MPFSSLAYKPSVQSDMEDAPIEDGGGGGDYGGGDYGGGAGGYGGGAYGGGAYGGDTGGGAYGGYDGDGGYSDGGYSPPDDQPDPDEYSKAVSASASGKVVTYKNADGSTYTQSGDHPDRDNNPLNIGAGRYADDHGAIGTDGKRAIFASGDDGMAAARDLMGNINNRTSNSSGQSWDSGHATVDNLITTWSPPGQNDTAGMIRGISSAAGVSADTEWSSMSSAQQTTFLNAYAKREGYHQ